MKELNKDYEERDLIIFGNSQQDYSHGGCVRFTNLSVEKLQELVDKNFANPEDRQNDAPTLGKFLEFGLTYPEITFHGYVVSPEREDYRVTIEGANYYGLANHNLICDFSHHFRDADEFVLNGSGLFCWYD